MNFLRISLIDNFSNCFSFHLVYCKNAEKRTTYCNKLKNIFKDSSQNNDIILIISDTSVKNNIVTSVSHIRREYEIVMKTIHYVMNVMSTETKLFVMRCSIGQVSQIQDITCIIIVTDTILAAKRIFDISFYPY